MAIKESKAHRFDGNCYLVGDNWTSCPGGPCACPAVNLRALFMQKLSGVRQVSRLYIYGESLLDFQLHPLYSFFDSLYRIQRCVVGDQFDIK